LRHPPGTACRKIARTGLICSCSAAAQTGSFVPDSLT
jgi:hypothetical protein